ncbi:MAG: pirin family protein [Hyphomicrobiales bacterium]
MIELRPFARLGRFDYDWLQARYHFSFADYHDRHRMHWGALRVWNDDHIRPGGGFARHGHSDMEIVTYIRKGAITHRDHLGNEGITRAGDVQVMSAGRGILHEEHNFEDEATELFQIWILPAEKGGEPYWQTAEFPKDDRKGRLVALASGRANDDGALPIRQNAAILGARLGPGDRVEHVLEPGRYAYLVAAAGEITVNGVKLATRDGAAIKDEPKLVIEVPADAASDAEIVLADVPGL